MKQDINLNLPPPPPPKKKQTNKKTKFKIYPIILSAILGSNDNSHNTKISWYWSWKPIFGTSSAATTLQSKNEILVKSIQIITYHENCIWGKRALKSQLNISLLALNLHVTTSLLPVALIIFISINTQVIIQNRALSLARYLGLSADNHLDGQNGCQ